MEQDNTTTTAPTEEALAPMELVRPVEGRIIAGVAAGIANRYGITTWVVRAVFVLLAFFGGLGIALYLAGWAVLRSEDETESPAAQFFGNAESPRSWLGIGLIFLAVLILLDNFTFLSGGVIWAGALLVVGILLYMGQIPIRASTSDDKEGVQQMTVATKPPAPPSGVSPAGSVTAPPPPTPPRERSLLGQLTVGFMLLSLGVLALLDNVEGLPIQAQPRHYLALAVTVLGIGLLVGSMWGRARWLILLAVVMVPTLVFSPVFEYNWTSSTFDRSINPTSFAQLNDTYSLDIGSLVVDLTHLDWSGEEISLRTHVGAGSLEVWIPEDVGLVGTAKVDLGRVRGLGRESFGVGRSQLSFNHVAPRGSVFLDATVDIGNIEIIAVRSSS